MNIKTLTLLLFVAVLVLVSCAGTGIRADDPEVVRETVAAGKTYEDCMKLASGQEVVYFFGSSMPLDFNIHYHVQGEEATYGIMEPGATKKEGSYRAPIDQYYCLMWTNPNDADVPLMYRYEVRD